MHRKVGYALVCEKNEDRVVEDQKWRSGEERKMHGKGGAAAWRKRDAGELPCDVEKWQEGGMEGETARG